MEPKQGEQRHFEWYGRIYQKVNENLIENAVLSSSNVSLRDVY